MTPLGKALVDRITASGPISLADYMADCLLDPQHGYYTTRDPLGLAGDFTTAPEISQMFGELIGLALAQAWMDQGRPERITLAELGPGWGTLMQDALRATRRVPGFHAALSVHLVEAAAPLRQAQASRVPDAIWHDRVETLPDAPLFLIANEFLDALPIRQFQRSGADWRERMVEVSDGRLAFGLAAAAPAPALDHRLEDTRDGDLVELCPALPGIVTAVASRIARAGGLALFIDYGDWRSLGSTLQAVAGHRFVDPFQAPGEADLTAHVDFEAIHRAAPPAQTTRMARQGDFLERLGISARTEALARSLDTPEGREALESHIAAHRRLTSPTEMGDLFKVIGIFPQDAPLPPGLWT